MKKVILMVGAVLFIFSNAQSQPYRQFDILVNAGFVQPLAPHEFQQGWKWGFAGGGGMGYYLTPTISIVGYADYNYFLFDTYNYTLDRDWAGLEVHVTGEASVALIFSGNLLYRLIAFEDDTFIYAYAGGGLLSRDRKDVVVRWYDIDQNEFIEVGREAGFSDSGAVIQAGAGIDFGTGATRGLYIEARYGMGFMPEATLQFANLRIGLRFSL